MILCILHNNLLNFLKTSKMLNRMPFNLKNYQCMNLIIKTEQGSQLWLGDYTAASDYNLLKRKQIKHVLTAAAMLNISYPKDMQVTHKTLHAFDSPTYKMTPHFTEAHEFIRNGLKNGNVLVHCAAGISRSTTCVLVFLMKEKCMTFKEALMLTRTQRPIVCPNHGFQTELSKLDIFLFKKGHYQKNKRDLSQKIQEQHKNNQERQKQVNPLKEFTNQFDKNVNMSKRFRSLVPNNLLLTNNSVNRKQTVSQKQIYQKSQSLVKGTGFLKPNIQRKDIKLPLNNFVALRLQVPKFSKK